MDAARIDGASVFGIYRNVILPLCVPTLATLAITTFMESWNDYLWPLLMLTDRSKMTAAHRAFHAERAVWHRI